MSGMSRTTATLIDDEEHLSQSIMDILSTRVGTRVMRRDYGSDLPAIIDQPINGETLVDIFQATAEALDKWEPRFKLTQVEVPAASAGNVSLILTGDVDYTAIQIEATVTT